MGLIEISDQNSTSKLISLSLVSRLYVAALNIGTVPILLALIGVEAFGLIGLSMILQSVFSVMDTGLGSAVSRQLARLGDDGEISSESLVASKGIEKFYWVFLPAVFVIAYFGSAAIAMGWEQSSGLTSQQISIVLLMLSGSVAAQWIIGFYSLALFGLHRAHDVSLLNAITWTMRLGGGVVVALLTSGSIVAYFAWLLGTAILSAVIFALLIRYRAPDWIKAKANIVGGFRLLGKAALSISALSACILIFNQVDKVIVGSKFSLETFGYYSLAWQIAGALSLLYNPVFSVYLPILSAEFKNKGGVGLTEHTNDGMTLLALLVGPVSAVIILFPTQILFVWTGNIDVAISAGAYLALAFAGAAISSLLFIPYAAQIASLRTELTLRPVILALGCMMVVMVFVVRSENPINVIAVWVLFNAAYVVSSLTLTAKEVLKVPVVLWWFRNILSIIGPGFLIGLVAQSVIPAAGEVGRIFSLWSIVIVYCLALGAAILVSDRARKYCRTIFIRLRPEFGGSGK